MTHASSLRPSMFARFLFATPIAGALFKDAGKSDNALIFALLNVAMLWALSGFIWGLEGVLAVALALTALALASLVVMMLSGGKAS